MLAAQGARGPATASRAAASPSTRRSSTRPTPNVDCFDDVPSTAAIYLDPDGTPRDVGTTLTQPGHGARRTSCIAPLRRRRGFYRGPIADAIVAGRAAPAGRADRRPHVAPGPDDRASDLAQVHARSSASPTHVDYRGLDVWGMGPPSSGGSTVGEALNILEGSGRSARDRDEALHRYLEASRYAYADRGAYLARPGVLRRAAARPAVGRVRRRAARADRPTAPPTVAPATRRRPRRRRRRRPRRHEGPSTTHLTVADTHGQRRDLHVHDRVDRRQRHRRPGLRASCSTTS